MNRGIIRHNVIRPVTEGGHGDLFNLCFAPITVQIPDSHADFLTFSSVQRQLVPLISVIDKTKAESCSRTKIFSFICFFACLPSDPALLLSGAHSHTLFGDACFLIVVDVGVLPKKDLFAQPAALPE